MDVWRYTMGANFNLKTLTVALAALSAASIASAAGLDRSGQDITAFLQDGTYAEAVYTYLDADVSGHDNAYVGPDKNAYQQGKKIDDIAESYDFFRYGVKADINDTFSVGVLYDEPFGAAAAYTGDNNFVTTDNKDALVQGLLQQLTGQPSSLTKEQVDASIPRLENAIKNNLYPEGPALETVKTQLAGLKAAQALAETAGEATNVEVRSESITAILGMKFGENKNFQVYGGPVAQRVQADVKLRGTAYNLASGYTTHISPAQDYGWLVGASYSKPEIALQAALTYRSEIDHSLPIGETFFSDKVSTIDITTPKSVNFDFQTGINPTTLATAKVRWVPWSDFEIVPPLYNERSGLPLVSYDEDQWLVELGLAKRLTPALAVTGNIGWDSGAGNPVTSLGPIEGYYSAGLGAKYNFTENWAISAGGKYLWFGDAKGQIPTKAVVSNFEDNDGFALGMKLSYQAK